VSEEVEDLDIEYVKNLIPIFTKPKRIKIIVGGRGSTKSTGVADYVNANMSVGQLWCCAREHQNSIEESVHRTLLDEIDRLGLAGFIPSKTGIDHASGGRNFYRGLSRNISSLKSTLSGIDGLWIEEGEDLSENTLRVLTASVRLNAKDSERLIAGDDVKMPEIIITMNRGSSNGAVAKKWLKRADKELKRCGYYEDEAVMIVEMNYTDMPEEWFLASGLEVERKDDYLNLPRAQYDHKWLGAYLDEVANSIIPVEWFDAAIDAHIKLGFKPVGAKIASHDPSDLGPDPKGYSLRHGSVFLDIRELASGDVNEGCDWATNLAIEAGAHWFNWDCDGLGVTLRRQVSESLAGTGIKWSMFKGSESPDNPDDIYMSIGAENEPAVQVDKQQARTNKDTFRNKRSQYYWALRDRFYNTYRAVEKGIYTDPGEMISLSSDIENMDLIRSEVCRIPRKLNGNGLIQILSKVEMAKLEIDSPNMSDTMMMSLAAVQTAPPRIKARTVKRTSARGWT